MAGWLSYSRLWNESSDVKDRMRGGDALELRKWRCRVEAEMLASRERRPLEVSLENGRPLIDGHLLEEHRLTAPMPNDSMAVGGAYVPQPVRPLAEH